MIEINLLPRELRRSTSGLNIPKSALTGIVGVTVFACVLGGLTFWQTQQLSSVEAQIVKAQAKVESMRADIELVDRLTNVKKSIALRLEAIETLDRNRGEWVRNLEDIVAVIPEYLWLSGFRRNDFKANKPAKSDTTAAVVVENDYLFDGYCYSLSSLANLVLNMQDSPRFSDVALRKATFTDVKDRKVYQFTVFCLLQPVSDEELDRDRSANPADLGGIDPNAPATEVSLNDELTDGAE
jgi:Tfp pilus assembly protein PilN